MFLVWIGEKQDSGIWTCISSEAHPSSASIHQSIKQSFPKDKGGNCAGSAKSGASTGTDPKEVRWIHARSS